MGSVTGALLCGPRHTAGEHSLGAPASMEHVTHGITLHGIARFVDIATDALVLGARGDRRPQRLPGARRGHRHQHVPHRLRGSGRVARGDGGRPRDRARRGDDRAGARRPAGGTGQLRGDPQPDAARVRTPARRRYGRGPTGRRDGERHVRGDRRELRRRGDAGGGHHPQRRARRVRGGAARRPGSRRHALARSCRPPPLPPGSRWRGPRSSSRCWPRPGWSTRAVAACASSSMPPRRPPPGDVRRRTRPPSAPTSSRSPCRPTT